MKRNEFSFRSGTTHYHVATGIDCDNAFYLYTEGVHSHPTHSVYPSSNEATRAFYACVSSIISKEQLGA
jgi:hypothetical protein